ncbi:hypothetical protein FXO38_27657 [Capsicum annuum]|nr:hypothetical protein FXO38_27657 [Capsicum annuum]
MFFFSGNPKRRGNRKAEISNYIKRRKANKENDEVYTHLTLLPLPDLIMLFPYLNCGGHRWQLLLEIVVLSIRVVYHEAVAGYSHRYSDKHDCPFDYKNAGQDAIANANPVVVAEKLNKI